MNQPLRRAAHEVRPIRDGMDHRVRTPMAEPTITATEEITTT
jgi:hypothetical protein